MYEKREGRQMKKSAGFVCLLFLLTNIGVFAQSVDLNTGIRNGATYFEQRLQNGINIAVLNVRSVSVVLSEYIIDELSSHFVNGSVFTVVDRGNLDAIQDEVNYQLSGEVSDETAQSIGRRIGAQTVIIGSIQPLGGEFLFVLRALSVETGVIQGIVRQDIKADNRLLALVGSDPLAPAPASKTRRDTVELGTGFSYFIEDIEISGIGTKSEMLSVAVNLTGASYYWDTVGIGAFISVFFPQKITQVLDTGSFGSFNRSDFDYIFGTDMLLGPVFVAYQHNNFSLPISAGLHLYMLSFVLNTSSLLNFSFGLGANVTGQYYINKNLYLLARAQVTFDFFSISNSSVLGDGVYAWLSNWGLLPSVGIGLQF